MSGLEQLWIFGYGSLIWRPDFSFLESRDGYVRGLERRFYQGSIDHRGLPHAPGRVVTLLPKPDAVCHGRAFLVAPDHVDQVTAHLDHRESGGYVRHRTRFHATDASTFEVTVYVAPMDNQNYLGPAPLTDMARQILNAHGPSGANLEYLLELAKVLRDANLSDDHVFELEAAVRALMTSD